MFRPTLSASVRGLFKVPVCSRSAGNAAAPSPAPSSVAADPDWDSAKPYNDIPGPKPTSLFSSIRQFMPGGALHTSDTSALFRLLNQTYGPMVLLKGFLGKPDIVVIYDPDLVAKVFRNEGTWPERRGADSLDYYFRTRRKGLPLSLAVSQGKDWQEFRTAVNQVMMQPRHTKTYIEPIDSVSQEFVDRIRAVRNDKMEMPPDFFNEIAKWSLESITYVALDARLSILKDMDPNSEGCRMIQAVHVVFDSMYALDFEPSPWKLISTPAYRRFIAAMDYFTEVATKYVSLAMERLKSLPPNEDRNYSVLENLLLRNDDPQKAVAMALDMLLAGVDTTGITVGTVLYQLAINPEKQRKLHEELDRVIPDANKPLSKEQLEELKYLRACIKETMRVMPVIIGNGRTLVKDMVIGGYQVPSGTMTSFVVCNTSDELFPRAGEFLPERWLPGAEDIKSTHPFAFLPFGFGPRMCVGKRFADLEVETVVAKILRNFSLEWHRPPVKIGFKMIMNFVDPLELTVKDRS